LAQFRLAAGADRHIATEPIRLRHYGSAIIGREQARNHALTKNHLQRKEAPAITSEAGAEVQNGQLNR
jgi:hypothetical protein